MTKLGRLVKSGYIKTFEEIYTYSLPIKEVGIVDHILASKKEIELKDEVMKIKPVQKQTKAGQAGLSVRGGGRDHHGGSCSWLAREGAVHGAGEVSETDDPVHPVGV